MLMLVLMGILIKEFSIKEKLQKCLSVLSSIVLRKKEIGIGQNENRPVRPLKSRFSFLSVQILQVTQPLSSITVTLHHLHSV